MKKLGMKAKSLSILIMLAASMIVPLALAKGPGSGKEKHLQAAYNGLNKGKGAKHLYLYEKDPETWDIVEGGSWGKITYIPHRDKFVFNGHGLDPEVYTLIYYPEPQDTWPWPVTEIDSDVADEEGNVHIKGDFDFETGMKIWLALSADIVDGDFTGWNPTEYLFEYNLIPQ